VGIQNEETLDESAVQLDASAVTTDNNDDNMLGAVEKDFGASRADH
jgi:hypothetical protein